MGWGGGGKECKFFFERLPLTLAISISQLFSKNEKKLHIMYIHVEFKCVDQAAPKWQLRGAVQKKLHSFFLTMTFSMTSKSKYF